MEKEHYQRGLDKAKLKQYPEAIAEFSQAIAIAPEFPAAYYGRGLAYYDSGDLENAIADYNRSLNLDDRQVEVYFCRALALLATDNIQGSIIDLQVIFNLDPNYVAAYKLRANICLRLQEIDRAIEYLKQAGKIYLNRKDKEACRLCIARIRELEQQKIKAQGGITNEDFLAKIRSKMRLGEWQEALADCSWLLQTDPYNAEAYHCRGTIQIELKNYQKAKADLRQAAQYFRSQNNLTEAAKMERLCLQLQLANAISQPPNFPADPIHPATPPTSSPFPRTSQPQNAIQHRLYMLVGDWNIAQRLVQMLKVSRPGMPETWYWEKVIQDIESDRR